jgi:hypothetical protein
MHYAGLHPNNLTLQFISHTASALLVLLCGLPTDTPVRTMEEPRSARLKEIKLWQSEIGQIPRNGIYSVILVRFSELLDVYELSSVSP